MRGFQGRKGCYGFLLVSVLFLFIASMAQGATWTTEAVDAPKYFAGQSLRAITLDSHGNPHIVYGGDNLYHAYYKRGKWRYETVDSSPGVGKSVEIAIDSMDRVHISYLNFHGDLKYAANVSGSWVTEIVETADPSQGRFGHASMALDSSNKAHISYYNGRTLIYATNASGAWLTEGVGGWSKTNSIAIDFRGNVHISYSDSQNLKYVTNASGTWVTETLGYGDEDISIAVDSSGYVHISYGERRNDSDSYISYTYYLKYTSNATGSWVTEFLETGKGKRDSYNDVIRGIGVYTSIAIDSSDKIHISYYDTNGIIKHAANASGLWVIESIGNVDAPSFTSISLDSSDKVHISYDNIGGDIIYATNVSGSWIPRRVDNGSDVGKSASIAVDPSDRVHISYYDATNRELKYVTNASGIWVVETVDSGDVGSFHSIAVDSSGNSHISYSRSSIYYLYHCYDLPWDCDETVAIIHDLKYATNASGSWVTETLNSSGDVKNASIAVDSSDNLHIIYRYADRLYSYSYYDTYEEDLKYITNASGSWATETIREFKNVVPGNLSVAADSSGKVHVSYVSYSITHYFSTPVVIYLTNTSGLWSPETVGLGSYASIAIDSEDNAHISYYQYLDYSTMNDLAYATNASGSWITDIVESAGDGYAYRHTSIAIDASDMAHISYYDSQTEELKYATNASGLWSTETVDSEGFSNWYSSTSIAVDSRDNAHIGYYDTLNRDLKYATSASQDHHNGRESGDRGYSR